MSNSAYDPTRNVPDASTTQAGVVERLTDAEFTAGTDTTRYPTVAQIASVSLAMQNKAISAVNNTIAGIDNANLATATGALGGPWQSWTPSLTAGSFGTGATVTASYQQIGKTIIARLLATVNASSINMAISITPPVTPATYGGFSGVGVAHFYDSSAFQVFQGSVTMSGAGILESRIIVNGTNGRADSTTNTNPFTWATGDTYSFVITYQAA